MKGQEPDPSSGVQGLLARGQEGTAGLLCRGRRTHRRRPALRDRSTRPVSSTWAARPARSASPDRFPNCTTRRPPWSSRPVTSSSSLDPQWLADLDDPTLVISPGYVGPDRRRAARDERHEPRRADTPGAVVVRRGVRSCS